MLRPILFVHALIFSASSLGQITFKNVIEPPFANFLDVGKGGVAFVDIDGDNDQDLVLTGIDESNNRRIRIYVNDGLGGYELNELVNAPYFLEVSSGNVCHADIDGDSDQDLFISGNTSQGTVANAFFLNDGNGVFYYQDSGLTPLGIGESQFVDIDNDSDLDLLTVGFYSGLGVPYEGFTIAYNDGMGNFSETFPIGQGMAQASMDVGDIDNDGDLDFVIAGDRPTGSVTLMYRNYNGNFTPMNGLNLEAVKDGITKYTDVDGDGDLDLFVYGLNNSNQRVAKLYRNNGTGNYTEDTNFSSLGLSSTAIDFSDVDLDGDIDFVVSGMSDFGPHTRLYVNDGSGVFTLSASSFFVQVRFGTVDFVDIENDGTDDILITGIDSNFVAHSQLYIGDGTGNFVEANGNPLEPMFHGEIDFADIDGDADLDMISVGSTDSGTGVITCLYRNDGLGKYTREDSLSISNVIAGDVIFLDVDQDADQDILISGQSTSVNQPIFEFYLNDGNGNFGLDTSQQMAGYYLSSMDAGDVDGDGDLDIIIAGKDTTNSEVTRLYINDGNGVFTEDLTNSFTGFYSGDVEFSDANGDGFLDLFICGTTISTSQVPGLIYLNNGLGQFTLGSSFPFPSSLLNTDFAILDADGDSDNDVFFSTLSGLGPGQVQKLCLNDGTGNFTLSPSTFPLLFSGNACAEDLDMDGDVDLFVTGAISNLQGKTIAYINDGLGNFFPFEFPSIKYFKGFLEMADIDGDLDPDLVTFGRRNDDEIITEMYRNVPCAPNTESLLVSSCTMFTSPSGAVWTSSGTYLDSVSLGLGCNQYFYIDLDITNIDVTVNQNNGQLSLMQSGANYEWFNCISGISVVGETSQTFTPTSSGYYAARIEMNGCLDTTECSYVNVVGIDEKTEESIVIYPNPTDNILTVFLPTDFIGSIMEIVKVDGTVIHEELILSEKIQLSTVDYASGVYLVVLKQNGNVIYFVKE